MPIPVIMLIMPPADLGTYREILEREGIVEGPEVLLLDDMKYVERHRSKDELQLLAICGRTADNVGIIEAFLDKLHAEDTTNCLISRVLPNMVARAVNIVRLHLRDNIPSSSQARRASVTVRSTPA